MAVVAERTTEAHRPLAEPHASPRHLGTEQVGVAAGQVASGIGNLAFTLVASRLLAPKDFSDLSVFLGLYLVISLPAASISAAAVLSPSMAALRRRVAIASLSVGAAVISVSWVLGPLLHLPTLMIVVLGLATPAVGPLAAQRGRLYAWCSHRWLVASLLAEPAVRLTLGVALAVGLGAVGGAVGVVVAGYAALEVARTKQPRRHARRLRTSDALAPGASTAAWTAAAFGLLAVVQNQDLVLANRILDGQHAGAYAALSTLGGAAALATVTIPLVLLPRALAGQRHAMATAVVLATGLGVAVVGVGAIDPRGLMSLLFGSRYSNVAGMVVPYLAAMGLLGIARVVAAYRCATRKPKVVLAIIACVAVVEDVCIVTYGHSVDSIAFITVGSIAVLTAALGADQLLRWHLPRVSWRPSLARLSAAVTRPAVAAVIGLALFGLVIRLVIFRGIWLDEATSIYQARLPFAGMLHDLQTTDVHPPLYYSVLWITERILGSGSFAMRVPSIVAGELVIPAAYLAARDLWSRRTGVIAAALASVGPILVWYSQEARMYSMFMLFAVLAVWGQVRALKYGAPRDWALFTLASAALVWTEYFGSFQVVAQQLFMVFALRARARDEKRRFLRGWIPSLIATAALIAPVVPFCWHQFMINQTSGKGFGTPSQVGLAGAPQVSIYSVLANMAWAAFGYHSAGIMAALVALWPAGMLLSVFLLGRRMGASTRLVLTVVAVPTLMLIGIAEFKPFLLDVRYISGVVVMVPLLIARAITGVANRVKIQAVACVAAVAVLVVGLGDEQVNGSNPRLYDFAQALHWVNARYHPGDLLVYDPQDLQLLITYYSPRVKAAALGQVPAQAAPGKEIFVLGSQSLMSGSQPKQLGNALADLRNHDIFVARFRPANVDVWRFRVPSRPGAATPPGPLTGGGRP